MSIMWTYKESKPIAEKLDARVVGSVKTKGHSSHDLDLLVKEYTNGIGDILESMNFIPVGSQVVSPSDIRKSRKFGQNSKFWLRNHRFENPNDHRIIEIWHVENDIMKENQLKQLIKFVLREIHSSPSGRITNMSPTDDDYDINYGSKETRKKIGKKVFNTSESRQPNDEELFKLFQRIDPKHGYHGETPFGDNLRNFAYIIITKYNKTPQDAEYVINQYWRQSPEQAKKMVRDVTDYISKNQTESTEPSIGGSFKDQQTTVAGTRDINQLERDPLLDPMLNGKMNENGNVT